MISNTDIITHAEAIAARDGGSWADHLGVALDEAHQPPLQKLVKKSNPADEAMRKKGAVAQLRHMPGTGDPDPDRRIEIGECETELGRVRVSVSRDELTLHGLHISLSEIDEDLRGALFASAAAFSAAILDSEQTQQKAIVAAVVGAIFRRHDEFITARVREIKRRELDN